MYCLVAAKDVAAGTSVLVIEGAEVSRPSRFSVQVGEHAHIDLPAGGAPEDVADRYPWQFTNHSCEPNTLLSGRSLVALRPIRAGEEVTFNYNTTEYALAEPFACHCGSPGCAKTIRGFRYLSRGRREQLRALLAPHLRRRLGDHANQAEQPTAL
jgi:hypothetical protein